MNKQEALEAAKKWNKENPGSDPIKFVAMDSDGSWVGYFEKPPLYQFEWGIHIDNWVPLDDNEGWQDTLTEVGE